MEIIVNGEIKTVAEDMNAEQLLQHLGVTKQRLAVEINTEIIPRSSLARRKLSAGDRVEIIQAIGGG